MKKRWDLRAGFSEFIRREPRLYYQYIELDAEKLGLIPADIFLSINLKAKLATKRIEFLFI